MIDTFHIHYTCESYNCGSESYTCERRLGREGNGLVKVKGILVEMKVKLLKVTAIRLKVKGILVRMKGVFVKVKVILLKVTVILVKGKGILVRMRGIFVKAILLKVIVILMKVTVILVKMKCILVKVGWEGQFTVEVVH